MSNCFSKSRPVAMHSASHLNVLQEITGQQASKRASEVTDEVHLNMQRGVQDVRVFCNRHLRLKLPPWSQLTARTASLKVEVEAKSGHTGHARQDPGWRLGRQKANAMTAQECSSCLGQRQVKQTWSTTGSFYAILSLQHLLPHSFRLF